VLPLEEKTALIADDSIERTSRALKALIPKKSTWRFWPVSENIPWGIAMGMSQAPAAGVEASNRFFAASKSTKPRTLRV
jgi:hypothetical protein